MTTNASIEESPFSDNTALPVSNAGLVLLNHHLQMLFDMCGYLNQRKFKDTVTAHRAVHLLQFLAAGDEKTNDAGLLLNKLLCGIPLTQTIDENIVLEESEKELCRSLLRSVISNWTILNDTSVDGLRGTFIAREGRLDESAPDKVTLTVTHRPYDMLLAKLPWSYTPVCFPWMPRALHTQWRL
jgi:hypothetical protein